MFDPLVTNIVQLSVATVVTALATALLGSFYFSSQLIMCRQYCILGVGAYSIAGTLWYILLKDEEVTFYSSSSLMVPMVLSLRLAAIRRKHRNQVIAWSRAHNNRALHSQQEPA